MILSGELFQEILHALRSDSTTRRNSEKRTQPRVGMRCSLDIISLKDDKTITVNVRDISVEGIGFVTSYPFAAGNTLIATFDRHDRRPVSATYIVTHCVVLSVNLYNVGAKLIQLLAPED